MRRLLAIFSLFASCAIVGANSLPVTATAVIHEMNKARTNPALYAGEMENLRAEYRGNVIHLPDHTLMRSKEGVSALDGAIHFLRNARPLPPFVLSRGMCRAAADHCADQASGRMGHGGSDFSSPGARLNRYGSWGVLAGENISYGKRSARDIVFALIIDDGLPSRKHRANIFNPTYAFSGAAFGPHARYRSVCSIEFAGSYRERDALPNESAPDRFAAR